jgi:hypothetical protein
MDTEASAANSCIQDLRASPGSRSILYILSLHPHTKKDI